MSSDKTQLLSMLLMALLGFSGAALLKISLQKFPLDQASVMDNLFSMTGLVVDIYFWLALVCYVLSLVCFLFLLQFNELSRIFPVVVGLNILVVLIGSSLMLGEEISWIRAFGTGAIILGIFVVYSS